MGSRLRTLLASAGVTALLAAAALALLLPPRGSLENPEYYANGSQIPVALRVAEQATDSSKATRARTSTTSSSGSRG